MRHNCADKLSIRVTDIWFYSYPVQCVNCVRTQSGENRAKFVIMFSDLSRWKVEYEKIDKFKMLAEFRPNKENCCFDGHVIAIMIHPIRKLIFLFAIEGPFITVFFFFRQKSCVICSDCKNRCIIASDFFFLVCCLNSSFIIISTVVNV